MNLEHFLRVVPPILSLLISAQALYIMMSSPQGTIVAARGPPDFGWDPIFQPQGFSLTYAEMESEVKKSISHRYKVLCALRDYLTGQGKEREGREEGVKRRETIRRPKQD